MKKKILQWVVKSALPFLGEHLIDEAIKLLEKRKEKLNDSRKS